MKKNPFKIGFVVSIFFWILTFFFCQYEKSQLSPQALKSSVQQQVSKQEKAINQLLENEPLMKKVWTNNLTEHDFELLKKEKFILNLYDSNVLSFWNRNDFVVTEKSFQTDLKLFEENGNWFLYRSVGKEAYPTKRLNIIIPIFVHYGANNQYIHSHFFASDLIPNSSAISDKKKDNDFKEIYAATGVSLFYLQIDQQNISAYCPGWQLLILLFCATFISVISIHLYALFLAKKASIAQGIVFLFFVVIVIQVGIYFFGLPFNLRETYMFSPRLFASNNFLPSFGHLLIHTLLLYWIFTFVWLQIDKFNFVVCRKKKANTCFFIFSATTILMVCISLYLQHLIYSVVFDSDIPFDASSINASNKFTLLALSIIALISTIFLTVLQIGYKIKTATMSAMSWRFFVPILIAGLIVLGYLFFQDRGANAPPSSFEIVLNVVIYIGTVSVAFGLSHSRLVKLFPRKGLLTLIFFSVLFAFISAMFFNLYADLKEKNISRVNAAKYLSDTHDTELEIEFDAVASALKNDQEIQRLFLEKDSIDQQSLFKHLKWLNTSFFESEYNQDLFVFDATNSSIFKGKSLIGFEELMTIKRASTATFSPHLFFKFDSSLNSQYVAFIPINHQIADTFLGTIVLLFQIKDEIVKTVYPKLLQSYPTASISQTHKYDFAVYKNNKIVSQKGEFNFSKYLLPPIKSASNFAYSESDGYSLLSYIAGNNISIVVARKNHFFMALLSTFSLLFVFITIILIIRSWLSAICFFVLTQKRIHFVSDKRLSVTIKYFILGFTSISFLIIGITTTFFIQKKHKYDNDTTALTQISNIKETLYNFLKAAPPANHNSEISILRDNVNLTNFLSEIAQQQKLDIDLFDQNGALIYSTQQIIYDKKMLSSSMSPTAIQVFRQKKIDYFINQERIGNLKFSASYMPLTSNTNGFLGYLSVPSFYTKEQSENEIISLISTLFNIYTILIIISSFITFWFVSRLSKSLRLVGESLKNVNLNKNELIKWPYNDEIGMLVDEYNKMIVTVEKTARTMVIDERQNAWREMAQQVAHEIKNPLTPMRLNIQYLQQAINTNHSDIIGLTKRVSASIIEQIDNLNYIASEFSNFAKMPENKSERIELKSVLERIILLFAGNKNISISHVFPDENIVVFADKSQMLRILTNIVQNAVEAMPDDREDAWIKVELKQRKPEANVAIIVSDNGLGISEEVSSKIFEPYFTTKSSGTGLGLAMSKKIIELWGGSISFVSTENVGTTFTINVPVG